MHAVATYSLAWHCVHAEHVLSAVLLQAALWYEPPAHGPEHEAHCAGAVAVQGLVMYWLAPHKVQLAHTVSCVGLHADEMY